MQTAIQWLIEKLDNNLDIKHSWRTKQYIEQAKEMEKQQIKDAFKNGDCNGTFETINAEQYYTSTYGSKGSDVLKNGGGVLNQVGDVLKSSQTEISDEEIETIGESYRIFYNGKEGNGNLVYKHYTNGIKWYREQLKNK